MVKVAVCPPACLHDLFWRFPQERKPEEVKGEEARRWGGLRRRRRRRRRQPKYEETISAAPGLSAPPEI